MSNQINFCNTLIYDLQNSVFNDVLVSISPKYGKKLASLFSIFNKNLITNILPVISEIHTVKEAIIDEIKNDNHNLSSSSFDNNIVMTVEENSEQNNPKINRLDKYYKLLSNINTLDDLIEIPLRTSIDESEEESDEEEETEEEEMIKEHDE